MKYRTGQVGELIAVQDQRNGVEILGCVYTSVGMVRGNNEDNVQIWALDDAMLGLVADGMGGAAGGEEASRLAVETIQSAFVEATQDAEALHALDEEALSRRLRDVFSRANQAVLDRAADNHELQGMGTTATMVLLRGYDAVFAHIGDSRAYVVDGRTNQIHQITSDHSFVEALVASGHLTQEQAEVHPLKNVLYRALGQKDEAEDDVDIYLRHLKSGDRLVMCSDGLSRHLKDQDIARLTVAATSPNQLAKELVDLANLRGGEDNVSVVVIFVKDSPS
ncbi:MAG: Stp1/IreP family PP2C-type Ser/Thr phosphatase [Anaerolineae bacterium]|nr:Stp1/IreP family PP2C-type Ser/Thr phosphatase [Anaerolineae bacterium]